MDFTETYEDTVSSMALAARIGDVALLKELIQVHNKPTNSCDNRGWRPLHEAASHGHCECVRLLVMADDAEVDALTYGGLSALYLAVLEHLQVEGEESECVKILLAAGADPDMAHGVLWSLPLPTAVRNVALVRQLLDAGADPNREEFESGTPLHAAVEEGKLESVSLLLDRGADMTNLSELGHTPCHALMLNHRTIYEPMQILKLFVDRGIDVNIRDKDGTTPLMLAVQSGWKDAVWKLLECGADVNITNSHGVLALHYAIEFPKDDSSRTWRKRKWECDDDEEVEGVNSKGGENGNYDGEEDTEVLEKLLTLTSTKKFMQDTDDLRYLVKELVPYSIYHLGVQWKRYKKLRVLLDADIPPDRFLQETSGQIADFTFSQSRRRSEVPLVLNNIGVSLDTPLSFLLSSWPITTQLVHLVKHMITKGSCVNALHPSCLPPLVALVKNQAATYEDGSPSLEILHYLIEKGADIMYKVRKSDLLPVALHVASLFNTSAFFRLLQSGVPAHRIYTHQSLLQLKQDYLITWTQPYRLYEVFQWLIISWLHTLHLFLPQLPLDTSLLFGMAGGDTNLHTAWLQLDKKIGSPKSLQQLCILSVRCSVGEAQGWRKVPAALDRLATLLQLPQPISDLLHFKQTCLDSLNHVPVHLRMTLREREGDNRDSDSDSPIEDSVTDSEEEEVPGVDENDEEEDNEDDDEEEEEDDNDDDEEEGQEEMSGEDEDEEEEIGEEKDGDEDNANEGVNMFWQRNNVNEEEEEDADDCWRDDNDDEEEEEEEDEMEKGVNERDDEKEEEEEEEEEEDEAWG